MLLNEETQHHTHLTPAVLNQLPMCKTRKVKAGPGLDEHLRSNYWMDGREMSYVYGRCTHIPGQHSGCYSVRPD